MSDKPINPFEAAKKRTEITAALRIADVLALRPNWSEGRARMLLDRHAAAIANAMLIAGTFVLEQLVEDEP